MCRTRRDILWCRWLCRRDISWCRCVCTGEILWCCVYKLLLTSHDVYRDCVYSGDMAPLTSTWCVQSTASDTMETSLSQVSQADHWMHWMMETLLSPVSQADHWMCWMMETLLLPVSWPDHWMRWMQKSKPKHDVELMYLLCSEFVYTREYCYIKVIYYYDYCFRVKQFMKPKLYTNIKIFVCKGLTLTQTTYNLSGMGWEMGGGGLGTYEQLIPITLTHKDQRDCQPPPEQ